MLKNKSSETKAVLMLLIACALWGMSFNWNKQGQSIFGERLAAMSGNAELVTLGPAAFLVVRFSIAMVFWVCLFPRSVRGWTRQTLFAGMLTGSLLSIGMLLQHYGLASTSESLSAFLTSLTVLFTPAIAAIFLRQKVSGVLWICVGLATVGITLMTLYRAEGKFDRGALLGLLCAIVFSGHILLVDHFGKREESSKFTLVQFLAASIIFTLFMFAWAGSSMSPWLLWNATLDQRLMGLVGLTVLFATLVTFGLMFRFQPQTTPTRAALTYLTEPLFATAYAWAASGVAVEPMALIGGGVIILSNTFAELFAKKDGSGDADVARIATDSDK